MLLSTMNKDLLYAGLSAMTGTELITPSEAVAKNITSEPIAIDHVFEYTYKPVRPTFQLHLQYPPREWVDLKVKTVTGPVTTVYVKKNHTLAQVKEAIEKENESLPAANQRLVFNMKQLESNDETVDSIGIEDGDTIEAIPEGHETHQWTQERVIHIKVNTAIGQIRLKVFIDYTIAAVKHEIEMKSKGSLPAVTQRLFFNKRLLSDEETVRSIGIKSGDTINEEKHQEIQINVNTAIGTVIKVPGIRIDYTIAEVKHEIELKSNGSLPADRQRLIFNKRRLSDEETVESIGIKYGDTLFLMMALRGGGPGDDSIPIVLDDDFLDPSFDYDFTSECDDGKVYIRGGEVYQRPYGWYRFALKVLDKYEDNTWLGGIGIRTESTAGEWPVSYHGTTGGGAEGIAKEGYDIKFGTRFLFGKGIYSTPDSGIAEVYATEFSKDGKSYKIVLQNRVNPAKLRKVKETGDQYWIVDDSDIRPYGILVKES